MARDRRVAGIGGIVFTVALVLGFTFFGPRGGFYAASSMSNFIGQSSTNMIVSIYLFGASIIGLLVLMAYLTETFMSGGAHIRFTWGASTLAAGSLLVGWSLYFAPSTSVISGGPAIDPAIAYTFVNAGFVVLFGAGGMFLGMALLTLAIWGSSAPIWVRAVNGLAGLLAFLSWAFLLASKWSASQWLPVPFYVVLLWGLAIGVWLLVTSTLPREATH
jgi:hypothetical protein